MIEKRDSFWNWWVHSRRRSLVLPRRTSLIESIRTEVKRSAQIDLFAYWCVLTDRFRRFLRRRIPTDARQLLVQTVKSTKLSRVGTNFEKITSFLHVTQAIVNWKTDRTRRNERAEVLPSATFFSDGIVLNETTLRFNALLCPFSLLWVVGEAGGVGDGRVSNPLLITGVAVRTDDADEHGSEGLFSFMAPFILRSPSNQSREAIEKETDHRQRRRSSNWKWNCHSIVVRYLILSDGEAETSARALFSFSSRVQRWTKERKSNERDGSRVNMLDDGFLMISRLENSIHKSVW